MPSNIKISKQGLCEKIKEIPGINTTSFDMRELNDLLELPLGSDFHTSCMNSLERLVDFPKSWAFLKPVKREEVPDYYEVIKKPMDFQTMREKVISGDYKNRDQFILDVQQICDNARLYNTKNTIYYKSASDLEKHAKDILGNLKNHNKGHSEWNANYLSDWEPNEKTSKTATTNGDGMSEPAVQEDTSFKIHCYRKGESNKTNNKTKRIKYK